MAIRALGSSNVTKHSNGSIILSLASNPVRHCRHTAVINARWGIVTDRLGWTEAANTDAHKHIQRACGTDRDRLLLPLSPLPDVKACVWILRIVRARICPVPGFATDQAVVPPGAVFAPVPVFATEEAGI